MSTNFIFVFHFNNNHRILKRSVYFKLLFLRQRTHRGIPIANKTFLYRRWYYSILTIIEFVNILKVVLFRLFDVLINLFLFRLI